MCARFARNIHFSVQNRVHRRNSLWPKPRISPLFVGLEFSPPGLTLLLDKEFVVVGVIETGDQWTGVPPRTFVGRQPRTYWGRLSSGRSQGEPQIICRHQSIHQEYWTRAETRATPGMDHASPLQIIPLQMLASRLVRIARLWSRWMGRGMGTTSATGWKRTELRTQSLCWMVLLTL